MNTLMKTLLPVALTMLFLGASGFCADSVLKTENKAGGDGLNSVRKRSKARFDPSEADPQELTAGENVTIANAGEKRITTLADRDDEAVKFSDLTDSLPNTMDGLNDKRQLNIGDKLSFKVVEDEVAPRSIVVTDSLEVDVPYIGRVPVASRTCKQFAFFVKRLLEKDYYYQATVLVGLDSAGAGTRAASRGKVYIMGQVRSAGAMDIPVDESLTITKAILRAGGFGPYANRKSVKLVRGGKSGNRGKPVIINCAEILDKGLWDKDVELNPDDIVTVPEKWISLF